MKHLASDEQSYLLGLFLIDGLSINCLQVGGTSLAQLPDSEGLGYRAVIEVGGTRVEAVSRLGWFEAAEGAVRQVLWLLGEQCEECSGGSLVAVS